MTTWPEVLGALVARPDLSADQTTWAMGEILTGEATPAQIAGFAVSLRAKGETSRRSAGSSPRCTEGGVPLQVPGRLIVVDTCGTGGDRSHTVNISTMAAVIAAAAGARVAKHGNRAASSSERLGRHARSPRRRDRPARWPLAAEAGRRLGITFCFAPVFHPAMRQHRADIDEKLRIRTVFNVLGPLANPARPAAQVLGVPDERMPAT